MSSRSMKSIRNFGLILYPDAENYDCNFVLNAVQFFFSEWAYVFHDKDVDENGELKKPHYHIACRKSSPSTISVVSNQLRVPENYIQQISNWSSNLLYLLHRSAPEKYQYDFNALHTNLPHKLFSSPEATQFIAYREIAKFIEQGGCNSLTQLNNWCIENGYWSEFRRNWGLFSALLRERLFVLSKSDPGISGLRVAHPTSGHDFEAVASAFDRCEKEYPNLFQMEELKNE